MSESVKSAATEPVETDNFIHEIIREDLATGGAYEGMTVHTRFPPEPNGFLHIGHVKAIVIDFGTAEKFGGLCNLRMDDTNPVKEDETYVEAIKSDIHWLGYDWGDRFYHASDYFEEMYQFALELIDKDLAFVCEMTAEEVRQSRGTLTEPGSESPWRNRPKEESRDLFQRMRAGEFADGSLTLRAKIDMNSGNMNMRDPVLYRILRETHHRTGDDWCIYPMYDFAHPLEDALEHITHSLCSLEFEDHRPLYEWVIDNTSVPARPRQIEFARLGINYTVMSKRKLRRLVEEQLVSGWDDPRLPTLAGLRRRGYTPAALRNFCERIGVSKVNSTVDFAFLEFCLREDLNEHAPRAMAVLDPIRLVIENYPEDQSEQFTVANHPGNAELGSHQVTFSRELYIEREDFMINPPRKYFRLFPDQEVRLRGAYIVRCTGYETDDQGRVTTVFASYDPKSRGGVAADGRKIRGTLHWVDAASAVTAEVRLYDRLFTVENPDAADQDYLSVLNPDSCQVLTQAKLEPWLIENQTDQAFQFMRQGYFTKDAVDYTEEKPVFNRSVTLKDSFKI